MRRRRKAQRKELRKKGMGKMPERKERREQRRKRKQKKNLVNLISMGSRKQKMENSLSPARKLQ